MNINDIKKVELHLHLDGSVRPSTLSELKHVSLKEAEENLIAKNKCLDLNEYLTKFSLPNSIMQSKENLERISFELAEDLIKDNCIYAEIRFAPNKHTQILSLDEVIESVLKGLKKTNLKTNLILCMMRGDKFIDNKNIIDLAYKYLNKGVVAIDLAGAEAIYKTKDYEELFKYASNLNIPFTIHAGEADGADSIMSAIKFGTKRIGHGVRAIEDTNCLKLIKNNNILLEICPTSNVQTNVVNEYKNHPIKYFYENNIKVSINTDNRTVSNITLNNEYEKLLKYFNFSLDDFKKMNIDAINYAFISDEEKKELINKLTN